MYEENEVKELIERRRLHGGHTKNDSINRHSERQYECGLGLFMLSRELDEDPIGYTLYWRWEDQEKQIPRTVELSGTQGASWSEAVRAAIPVMKKIAAMLDGESSKRLARTAKAIMDERTLQNGLLVLDFLKDHPYALIEDIEKQVVFRYSTLKLNDVLKCLRGQGYVRKNQTKGWYAPIHGLNYLDSQQVKEMI